jgi:hypothetical protein
MGHSHHWIIPDNGISEDAWATICDQARRLFDISPVKLVGNAEGTCRKPRLDSMNILFNGADGTGCEDLLVRRRPEQSRVARYEHIKTDRQPYDIVVLAVLAIIQANVPDFVIESDGTFDEWVHGAALAAAAAGTFVPVPRLTKG